jgi:hypothetical protein
MALRERPPEVGVSPKQVGTWALGEEIFECGRIKAGGICAIGRFLGTISASALQIKIHLCAVDLDMSEQGAETQVLGKYCRSVS